MSVSGGSNEGCGMCGRGRVAMPSCMVWSVRSRNISRLVAGLMRTGGGAGGGRISNNPGLLYTSI